MPRRRCGANAVGSSRPNDSRSDALESIHAASWTVTLRQAQDRLFAGAKTLAG